VTSPTQSDDSEEPAAAARNHGADFGLPFSEVTAMSILIENENELPRTLFLKARRVRERYGHVSHMWIERRRKDADFPPPVYFGGMRFWKISELERWEFNQTVKPTVHSSRGLKSGAGISHRNRSVRP
jgi:predicted DNA-binding transcriptional regulator AlpA